MRLYREINDPERFHYCLSYEIVLDVFANRWLPDRRHVKEEILAFIMTLFELHWCKDARPEKT